jgi:hypothetical protein
MRASPLSIHNSMRPRHLALLLTGIVLLGPAGCRKTVRTEDPQLKPLQEILDAQLPPGTSAEKVKVFLRERDCVALPSQKPGTLVVLIPIAQNREASAATARAIFYFDANGKLNTFELARASGDPAQQ